MRFCLTRVLFSISNERSDLNEKSNLKEVVGPSGRSKRLYFGYCMVGAFLPIKVNFANSFQYGDRIRVLTIYGLFNRLIRWKEFASPIRQGTTGNFRCRSREGGRPFLFRRRANLTTSNAVGRFASGWIPVKDVKYHAGCAFIMIKRHRIYLPTRRTVVGRTVGNFLRLVSIYPLHRWFHLLLR